ncbi:WD40 repeat protein [Ceratobasidium sp. AG-Ba]|nr:WD40 repeat protein [Ceratobasidium sp. AG-Ba]
MPSQTPPPPFRTLRTHTAQINTLQFASDNEYIIAGDASGRVTVTSTRTWRPVADWTPHTDSVLGVQEWEDKIITHGRDYKLHVWRLTPPAPLVADAAGSPTLATPSLVFSLDVNSLNFCRFALCSISPGKALLALPNLVESELIDIWEIPNPVRLHAGIGTIKGAAPRKPFSDEGRDLYKAGVVMSLHVSETSTHMRILAAYESGTVTLWVRPLSNSFKSVEGQGWETAWSVKQHSEAVMGMAVTRDNSLAATISADHFVCRYRLERNTADASEEPEPLATKHLGNGAIAFRADGRVIGTAGWDGAVRLYSAGRRKMRPLGTLDHFKESCFAIVFASDAHMGVEAASGISKGLHVDGIESDGVEEDRVSATTEFRTRSRWLAVGGKNGRVILWELDSFEKR